MNRLYRSPNDRVFAGVAGGMAETYDLDPALVRVGWLLLALVSGGIFLVVYVVMALVIPLRPHTANLWATASGGTSSGPDMPGWSQQTPQPAVDPTGYAPTGWAGNRAGHRERGANVGPIVIGVILIIVGGFFLARQFIPALDFGLIWPVVAIVGGLLLIAAAFVRQRPGT